MKICTITCHEVYNYGASLQAYALQTFCQNHNCEYEIIDYKPDYLSGHYNLWAISNDKFDKPIIRYAYLLAKLPGRLVRRVRKYKFDSFTANYLCITKDRYSSCKEIEMNCPHADMYIAGSDQIWNTIFPNGHDSSFYLNFVHNGARRISYAASFATDKIYNEADEFVSKQLKNFDAISVRELGALSLLNKLGISTATLVVDPVFLLDSQEWQKLIRKKPKNKKYIFLYDCEKSKQLKLVAKALQRATGLPIYNVSEFSGKYANRDYSLSGPLEFLQLLSDAEFVVANSFHALAFSLIFKKQFYIINRTEKINSRMADLLEYLGIKDRLIAEANISNVATIDYNAVSLKLHNLVSSSKQYLLEQIRLASKLSDIKY